MFATNSRYYSLPTYTVTLSDGTQAVAVASHMPNPLKLAGWHRNTVSDRLDLLAARFLQDPTLFWQICDSNNAPTPDALAAATLVGIPVGPATS